MYREIRLQRAKLLQQDDDAAGNLLFSTAGVQDAKFNPAYVGLLGVSKPAQGIVLSS